MRTDCFAYVKEKKLCRLIKQEYATNDYCENKCPFYKTREQYNEGERKARERLADMGYDTSRYNY